MTDAAGRIRLTSHLICANDEQVWAAQEHLPRHIELARAEPGCLSFDVHHTDNPLVWHVNELFTDERAFHDHQQRVATSDWGRATVGIERRYSIHSEG